MKKTQPRTLAVIIVGIGLLYVLSFPLAVQLARPSQPALEVLWVFYAPVRHLHDIPALQKPFEAYCNLFGPGFH